MYLSISMNDFIGLIDKVNIIDIRSHEMYMDGHIHNSVNINPYDLANNPYNYLDMYRKYYIYCENGEGSLKLCSILAKKGYDVVNIEGGFKSYIKWNLK